MSQAADEVVPNYGLRKVRVGVKIASGAHVEDGASTRGSELTLVEAGPVSPFNTSPFTCTTDAGDAESTATYCGSYLVAPGNTLTITQTTAAPGLTWNGRPVVVQPCEVDPETGAGCGEITVLLEDTGTPPKATRDTGTVDGTGSLTLDVLRNDDSAGAPITSFTVSKKPSHGTAQVLADNELQGRLIAYVPTAGFVGVDTFTYTFGTGNGTASAEVRVTVTGEEPEPEPTATQPPSVEPTSAAPSPTRTTVAPAAVASTSTTSAPPAVLASTGGSAAAGVAGLLGVLLSGAGAALLGRRRHRGRHV